MSRVTFHGACGVVTGSCTHLVWGGTSLLVDCGLFQGPDELEQRNWQPFPFDPAELTAILLTHAHLDHCGRLPLLIRNGFTGPIYCTRPTRGLARLVLEDAGELQEETARFARRKGYSRHADPQPLFTREDARRTLGQLEARPFDQSFDPAPGIRVAFRRAGHLLGAASIEVGAKGSNGERRHWIFSGDLGRFGVPILRDPQPPGEPAAAVVLESTYGDRRHPAGDVTTELGDLIERVFTRGGTAIIPAFALGRTQLVLYHLSLLVSGGRLDAADVFLDSPMAARATELYEDADAEHDLELQALRRAGADPLTPRRFTRCESRDDSIALNGRERPAVIVASSGMATGGRVVHHLKQKLPDERHAVIFVGFQAAGTRGRQLVDGATTVRIHGEELPVRAEIVSLAGMSAHADRDELVHWCRALSSTRPRVFLNHGEEGARASLAEALHSELGWSEVSRPADGDSVAW